MMESLLMPDMEWKEANSLAGLFQRIVGDCKVGPRTRDTGYGTFTF